MKKILMTLMYCMIFLAVPVTAYAAKDQTDTYEYEIRDGKAVLTRYATSSNATRVVVPDKAFCDRVIQHIVRGGVQDYFIHKRGCLH